MKKKKCSSCKTNSFYIDYISMGYCDGCLDQKRSLIHNYRTPIGLKRFLAKASPAFYLRYNLKKAEYLGEGISCRVFRHCKTRVIKITSDLSIVLANQHLVGKSLKHISRVYSVVKIDNTDFYAIITEYLPLLCDYGRVSNIEDEIVKELRSVGFDFSTGVPDFDGTEYYNLMTTKSGNVIKTVDLGFLDLPDKILKKMPEIPVR